MRYLTLFLLSMFIFVLPNKSNAEDLISVKLVQHVGESSEIDFQVQGNYMTLDPMLDLEEGVKYRLEVDDGTMYLTTNEKGERQKLNMPLILYPQMYDNEHIIFINDRPYLGAIEFKIEDNQYIRPVNQLPLEDYLKGVVPFEVYPSWGIETLKAQALAARTYAISHMDDEDLNDTISYQVYGGYTWSDKATTAVEETSGEVLTYNNKLIDAFYSASNGGYTENNANVWGGKEMSYFPIKKDPYDPIEPWEFTLNETQINLDSVNWDRANWWDKAKEKNTEITASIKKGLTKQGFTGDIKIISIPSFELSNKKLPSKRSVQGSISVEFMERLMEGTVLYHQFVLENVNLNQIRPLIGGSRFKSYFIDSLSFDGEKYRMEGRGYGHGVGMSQWGAHYMAESGKTYKEILQFYYPNTSVKKIK